MPKDMLQLMHHYTQKVRYDLECYVLVKCM